MLKSFIVPITLFLSSLSVHGKSPDNWEKTAITALSELKEGDMLFHSAFYIDDQQGSSDIIHQEEIASVFLITEKNGQLFVYLELAEQNILMLKMDVADAHTAYLSELSCDCNLGIERSIFNHNPDPFMERIATVSVESGVLNIEYTDVFKKAFLELSTMATEYFKDSYTVYRAVQQ